MRDSTRMAHSARVASVKQQVGRIDLSLSGREGLVALPALNSADVMTVRANNVALGHLSFDLTERPPVSDERCNAPGLNGSDVVPVQPSRPLGPPTVRSRSAVRHAQGRCCCLMSRWQRAQRGMH